MSGPRRGTPTLVAVAVALGIGALIATQGRVNADLASIGPGVIAAGWSAYAGTWVSIVLVVASRRRLRHTVAVLRRGARWWWFAIGLCSVPIVYAMSFGVPVLGVALASVCSVAGQTISGTLLDARGIGLPAPIRITARRVLAGLCALAGLTVAMLLGPGGVTGTVALLAASALGLFVGGFLLSVQQSGNGLVTQLAGDPVTAALTSVTGGLTATSLIAAVAGAGSGWQVAWPGFAAHWVLYLGGPLGAVITVASAWAVRHLGSFALTLAIVGGQLVAAILLDTAMGIPLQAATAFAIGAVAAATFLAVDRRTTTSVAT